MKIYSVVTDAINDFTQSHKCVNTCLVITLFITGKQQHHNNGTIFVIIENQPSESSCETVEAVDRSVSLLLADKSPFCNRNIVKMINKIMAFSMNAIFTGYNSKIAKFA